MEKDPRFLVEYSEFLHTESVHVPYGVFSLYINFIHTLSEKEKQFIETHIGTCRLCRTRLEEVFDTETEFDDAKEQMLLRRAPALAGGDDEKTTVRVESDDKSVLAVLQQDPESGLLVTFEKIPPRLIDHGIRLTFPNVNVVVRMISAKPSNVLPLFDTQSIRLDDVQDVRLEATGMTAGEVRRGVLDRREQMPYLKYAAIMALFIGLSTIAVLYFTRTTDVEKIVKSGEKPPEPAITRLLDPQNFKVHPILERFVDRTLRSPSDVKNVSPRNGDTLAMPITFRWDGKGGENTYGVTVVDNKNSPVWTADTREAQITMRHELAPGLYYVKLEINGSLARVQKFFVTGSTFR